MLLSPWWHHAQHAFSETSPTAPKWNGSVQCDIECHMCTPHLFHIVSALLPQLCQPTYVIGTVTCVLWRKGAQFFIKQQGTQMWSFTWFIIITSINAFVASNSPALKHKHFYVHQLLALLKRCNRRVQPSYKQMLLWHVAIRIHNDHTHVHT